MRGRDQEARRGLHRDLSLQSAGRGRLARRPGARAAERRGPAARLQPPLPPAAVSVHTTFLSDRFVVCTFAPRPFETDPGALKVPFFHNNDDFDEVLFYHAGDFFSRDHIEAGMMTFHPSGFTHGPHPKALKNMLTQPKSATDEYAVMIDTRDPLEVGEAAASRREPGLRRQLEDAGLSSDHRGPGSRRPRGDAARLHAGLEGTRRPDALGRHLRGLHAHGPRGLLRAQLPVGRCGRRRHSRRGHGLPAPRLRRGR